MQRHAFKSETPGAVAVLDIGKTNVKLELFNAERALLWERSIPNIVLPDPPYPHADVEAIWAFLIGALADANNAHPIGVIVPTTHGCAGALIDEAGLMLPVLDYEFAGVEAIEPRYATLRPPYAETLSPPLPAGLNQGRQIAWQQQNFPDAFAKAKLYLTYPQYWSWRLTGVASSEVTMLGCHSDLWAPLRRRPSSLAAKLDLPRLTPALRSAWDRLGPLKPEIAARTGLGADARVLCGVHDSNASMLPHLASRKPPFTIVSTGTWVILMAVGLRVEGLNAAEDMLANVDVEGRPTACARFMGGREYSELIGAEKAPADEAALARVIASGAMALPCFAPQGGPFVSRKGEIRGDVMPGDRPALATLYVALMSDLMLTRLGAYTGDLIVEGSFAKNSAYCELLATLRPEQRVFAGDDCAGTARGAALLAQWPLHSLELPRREPVEKSTIPGLDAYREAWDRAVAC
jgi:sugar (pentulose or hexulose) kinase